MALTLLSVWGHVARPWGWEVRVDLTDEAGAIHNEVLTFPAEPSAPDLDAAVAACASALDARLTAEAAAALKAPEPTREELVAKVAELNAVTVSLVAEREALVVERDSLVAVRDGGLVAEPDVVVRRVG
jgi:hypothetical protein